MRKSHLLAALAAGVVVVVSLLLMTLSGSDAAAQAPGVRPQTAPPPIALLDVSHIFKEHVRLKAAMAALKKEVEATETWVKNQRDTINGFKEQLKQFKPGSPEYKSLEERIVQREGDLAIKVRQQRRDFLLRESRIYYTTYQEIQQEVNYYCQARNVAVVFRFSRDTVDMDKPETVLAHINKQVITYDRNLDITDLILNQLNRQPAGGGTNPVGSRQRPGVPLRR